MQSIAWSSMASEIDACRQQLRICEKSFNYGLDANGNYYEDEVYTQEAEYLGYLINQAHLRMLILIELAQLPSFLAHYSSEFSKFKGMLSDLSQGTHDHTHTYSKPLSTIIQGFEALSSMVRGQDSHEINQLDLLERILRQTPYIISDQGIVPSSEKDVRKAMFDQLKVIFPDVRREIPVSHLFKTYKADLGSSALKVLIEVKYALDEKELRSELDGIYADMKGYNGDPQWDKFFAVIYTAVPIASPERIAEEFKLSRADLTWMPIVVHGPGTRPFKTKQALNPPAVRKPRRRST